jgi:cytochrome c biogenesis protein CcdA/glutaredoxin-related protein
MIVPRICNLLLSGLLLGLVFWPGGSHGQDAYTWVEAEAGGVQRVHLYFFWSERCPHCLEARPFIEALPAQHPWINLHSLEISRSRENLQRYVDMAASLGQEARSVPALLFCGQMQVGWDSGQTSGADLLARLSACREPTIQGQPPVPVAQNTLLHVPLLGEFDAASLSLPVLTVVIAGLDAFNPCAFFVLLFLLSLMAHQQDRHRMLLIGGVFVFISGFMYFAFMVAWLGLFRVMGSLPWVTTGAGVLAAVMGAINVKDFFAFRQGVSLSIPESRKADIFRRGRAILAAGSLPAMLVATALLATAANFYELLCTAGLPMIFTRLLTLHEPDIARHLLYLALYNVIYVLPMLAIVLAFTRTMGARKLSEREGRLLKLLSGLMMLGLGVLLLTAPERLDNLGVAFGLLLGAALLTWLAARWSRGRAAE